MPSRYRRNIGKHTSAEQAKRNVLVHCKTHGYVDFSNTLNRSDIGRVAFPEYRFKKPQGAAFAVARIIRDMEASGLIRYASLGQYRGYHVTSKGLDALKDEFWTV